MKENVLAKAYQDFKALSPSFTGERYTLGAGIRIAYEHFNRYCFAYQNISKDDIVLDLACGTGYGSILLAQKAKAVYAVDIDQTSLDLLALVCKKHNITNIFTVKSDINEIQQCSDLSEVSAVVCHELIEHITEENQINLLKKISSGVKPFSKNCKFFVSTPEKQVYNQINANHNEFHLNELSKSEFVSLVSSNFKQSKFFWQMPISGDLIAPFDNCNKNAVNFIKWTDRNNLVAHPSQELEESQNGIYMYAIASNSKVNLDVDTSIIIDPENRELQERFVIAAEELETIKKQQASNSSNQHLEIELQEQGSEQKLLVASAKKIKELTFTAEKASAQKVLLEKKIQELEKELAYLKPIANGLNSQTMEVLSHNPNILSEAIMYYGLRNRFAHRLGNFLLFKLQTKKPFVVINRLFKFIKLVKAS